MRIDSPPSRPAAAPRGPVRASRPAARAEACPLPPSHAARRVRDGLGTPVGALPGVEREDGVYVREHTRAPNEVISGRLVQRAGWLA